MTDYTALNKEIKEWKKTLTEEDLKTIDDNYNEAMIRIGIRKKKEEGKKKEEDFNSRLLIDEKIKEYKETQKLKKTYLMKDNHNNFYKIGYSKNPRLREKTLQSEKPSIKMVKVWDYDIERKLHDLYDEFRVRGEWFNLSKIQVRYICTHF
tara:strand:- start:66 stop:518 length:453 start_codon:yes stop_codon:yes gene_type:complete